MASYAKAEELGMPVLFHMGVIGGGLDYSITHPRRDAAAAQAYQRMMAMQDRMPARNVSASRMSPLHLDTIANRFPRLKIIGAHLGNQGNYEYAASVARWRHNVWFDMSGGETIERHAVERKLIGVEGESASRSWSSAATAGWTTSVRTSTASRRCTTCWAGRGRARAPLVAQRRGDLRP